MQYKAGVSRVSGYYGRYNQPGSSLKEKKFFDGELKDGPVTVSSVGVILEDSLVEIPQGTGESERLGRKCLVEGLALRGSVTSASGATPQGSDDQVRIIVYQDKQTNGAAATVTDILESADWRSFNNLANSQRFRILHTEMLTFNVTAVGQSAAGTFATLERTFMFDVYKKCNLELEFSNTTGAITELKSNNIGILAISRAGATSIDFKWRVRFTG